MALLPSPSPLPLPEIHGAFPKSRGFPFCCLPDGDTRKHLPSSKVSKFHVPNFTDIFTIIIFILPDGDTRKHLPSSNIHWHLTFQVPKFQSSSTISKFQVPNFTDIFIIIIFIQPDGDTRKHLPSSKISKFQVPNFQVPSSQLHWHLYNNNLHTMILYKVCVVLTAKYIYKWFVADTWIKVPKFLRSCLHNLFSMLIDASSPKWTLQNKLILVSMAVLHYFQKIICLWSSKVASEVPILHLHSQINLVNKSW